MKKTILTLAATAAALVSLSAPAAAAPFQSVDQRQANLFGRIDQGMRSGALTRSEAATLRVRFARLQRLERQYRRGGLTLAERRDLDRRFDALSNSIRAQKHDRDVRRR
ncbi:MAG TPA: hypothetical protein VGD66_13230 [Allosphingosinicella sp.]